MVQVSIYNHNLGGSNGVRVANKKILTACAYQLPPFIQTPQSHSLPRSLPLLMFSFQCLSGVML